MTLNPARYCSLLALLLATLVGCAADAERRAADFQTVLLGYENAIRWGNFRLASSAMKPDPDRPPTDLSRYQGIRVTSYTTITQAIAKDGLQVAVESRIGYYHSGALTERLIDYPQQWDYDTERQRWYLVTGLPEFK